MSGPYRFYVWLGALAASALPFFTLNFFLPDEKLVSVARMNLTSFAAYLPSPVKQLSETAVGWLNIPDPLIPDFAFIGVAIFLACVPGWVTSESLSVYKNLRRHLIISFRLVALIFAIICLFHYIRIGLQIHQVPDKKFVIDLAHLKSALFMSVLAVCVTSFVAVALSFAPDERQRQ